MKRFDIVRLGHLEHQLWEALSQATFTHLFLSYPVPGLSLTDTQKRLGQLYPEIRVILINSTCNFFLTQQILQQGARAVIGKNTGRHELDFCLHSVNAGRKYISKDIQAILNEHANIARPQHFTPREIQVLQYIAMGYTIDKTAELLHMSKHTVVTHRRNMMDKSGLKSAPGLVNSESMPG